MTETTDTPAGSDPAGAPASGNFEIPEDYKNSGWSKNIKSVDDLWKSHANAQSLIGKKTIGIPGDGATEKDFEEFYSKVRPESADKYDLKDLGEEDKKLFQDIFFKNGLSKKQADGIISAYKSSVDSNNSKLFGAEGLKDELTKVFGEKYEEPFAKTTSLLREILGKDDQSAIDKMPNSLVSAVYKVAATLAAKYAVKDTDIGKQPSGNVAAEKDIKGYIKEMESLNTRNHTQEEKQAIQRKYGIIK